MIPITIGIVSVLDKMKKNMGTTCAAVKRQYIISDFEIQSLEYSPFYLCHDCDESILWENYMSRRKYQTKNIVLVLDNGSSINRSQLHILKNFGKNFSFKC